MRSAGWRVARSEAERVRRDLRERGSLRVDLEVQRTEEFVTFPLLGPPIEPLPSDGVLVEAEFAPSGRTPTRNYRDLLDWGPEAVRRLPRSYDVVGDVVLVRIPVELLDRSEEIGRALLAFVPGARVVGRDEGVRGTARRRQLVPIAGAGGFRTRHRENGLDLQVDLERAYFSPRLGREHSRVAELVRPEERVLDLCCGVGPFALTIARDGRAREVVAVDSNPEAIELLESNLGRLHPRRPVRAIVADVAEFVATSGVADRVVLNLPHEGIKYLTSVGKSVAPAGVLHYYEVTERSASDRRPEELLRELDPGGWALAERHVVHPYSPRSDLVEYALSRAGP
ncbi:MAG TPA: methyltransferase domain-containing protein [Thermoplasmata archaeon]